MKKIIMYENEDFRFVKENDNDYFLQGDFGNGKQYLIPEFNDRGPNGDEVCCLTKEDLINLRDLIDEVLEDEE